MWTRLATFSLSILNWQILWISGIAVLLYNATEYTISYKNSVPFRVILSGSGRLLEIQVADLICILVRGIWNQKMPAETTLPLWCRLARILMLVQFFDLSFFNILHAELPQTNVTFSRWEIQGFFSLWYKVCICALTFERNLYGCHNAEKKELLIALYSLQFCKSAVPLKFLGLTMHVCF